MTITRFWGPFDSWNSWQLVSFLPSSCCWPEEEDEGEAPANVAASGSLCCLGRVPCSTLGGFSLFSPSFLTLIVLNMNPLPCWKRLGLTQRITLGSPIIAKVIQAGEC